jgi:selenocysteine lyase/cysteine desulfurase
MISWGASEGSHINALAAFHDDARYWYFSNLLRTVRARYSAYVSTISEAVRHVHDKNTTTHRLCLDSRKIEQERRQNHQVHVRYRQVRHIQGLRVSPHIYMLKSELDIFVAALKQVVEGMAAPAA